jgi:hypothetical protein
LVFFRPLHCIFVLINNAHLNSVALDYNESRHLYTCNVFSFLSSYLYVLCICPGIEEGIYKTIRSALLPLLLIFAL